jgi:hypothetical protein
MASNDNNNRNGNKHLFYLDELSDYKVSSDDPDVRGWKVKDADDRIIGKVDNLLVNKNTERVVYLDVEVDKSIIDAKHEPYSSSASEGEGVHEFMNKDGEEHLIIPIGLVKLNEDDKFIYTDKVNHKTFAQTKRMKKGSKVNREYEKVVLASYDRDINLSSDRNKNVGDKKTVSDDYKRDESRVTKLTKDPVTEKSDHRKTDFGNSDVSNKGSQTNDQDSRSRENNEELASFDDKKTSFSSKKNRGSNPANSRSEKSATSKRVREDNMEEDFYNKKEFDDENYRKKR